MLMEICEQIGPRVFDDSLRFDHIVGMPGFIEVVYERRLWCPLSQKYEGIGVIHELIYENKNFDQQSFWGKRLQMWGVDDESIWYLPHSSEYYKVRSTMKELRKELERRKRLDEELISRYLRLP